MNLTNVNANMSRGAARQAFLDYRHAVQDSIDKEASYTINRAERERLERQREADEAIMSGYRQLSLGRQVVDLRSTVAAGGLNKRGLPAIALARADVERVYVQLDREGAVFYDNVDRRHASRSATRYTLPNNTLAADRSRGAAQLRQSINGTAIVPSIPPMYRPSIAITKFWLLFEAEYDKPPVDPALVKPIGGGLAVVVATWDLTPLERAVLGMTR